MRVFRNGTHLHAGKAGLALLACWALGAAALPHSAAVKAEFRRSNPCPATGQARGACPGFIVDHRVALCAGGPDAAGNMRWMTTAAAKAKDRWECKPGWAPRLDECERAGCFWSPESMR